MSRGFIVAMAATALLTAGFDCDDEDECTTDSPTCEELAKPDVGPYWLCDALECGAEEQCLRLDTTGVAQCIETCMDDTDCSVEGTSCRTIEGENRVCAGPNFGQSYLE